MVRCDVTKWDEQLALFKEAIAHSPNKRIDIVVANAGIGTNDDISNTDRRVLLRAASLWH